MVSYLDSLQFPNIYRGVLGILATIQVVHTLRQGYQHYWINIWNEIFLFPRSNQSFINKNLALIKKVLIFAYCKAETIIKHYNLPWIIASCSCTYNPGKWRSCLRYLDDFQLNAYFFIILRSSTATLRYIFNKVCTIPVLSRLGRRFIWPICFM